MNISDVSAKRLPNIEIVRDGLVKKTVPENQTSFVDEMGNAIKKVDAYQKTADKAMENGAIKGPEDIHEAMIRLQEAEISLRLFMQVKNKAIEAYREIMRMQV